MERSTSSDEEQSSSSDRSKSPRPEDFQDSPPRSRELKARKLPQRYASESLSDRRSRSAPASSSRSTSSPKEVEVSSHQAVVQPVIEEPPKEVEKSVVKRSAPKKQYAWTFSNYTEDEILRVQALIRDHCRYGVYGKEVAPTTGTPHLQGYLVLNQKQHGTFIQKKMSKRKPSPVWFSQTVRASAKINREYCLKIREKDVRKGTPPNQEFWEHPIGGCPEHLQGERTELEQAFLLVKAKGPRGLYDDVDSGHIILRYPSGVKMVAQLAQKVRGLYSTLRSAISRRMLQLSSGGQDSARALLPAGGHIRRP